MKKRHFLFVLLFLTGYQTSLSAQIRNYNADGHLFKTGAETTSLQVIHFPEPPISAHVAGPLVTIGAPLVGLAINGVKSYLKNREQRFTAVYQASASDLDFYKDGLFNLDAIRMTRHIWNSDTATQACILRFKVLPDQNLLFRLRLDTLSIDYAKACIKNKDDRLTLNIDLEITGFYKETNPKNQVQIKSLTLGKTSMQISNIRPGQAVVNTGLYSDWFAMLPLANQSDKQNGYGWFSIKLTVKEANQRGINTTRMLDFFNDNGSSLQDLMKGILSAVAN